MGAPFRDAILEVIFHEIAECVYPYKFKSVWYSFIQPSDHTDGIIQQIFCLGEMETIVYLVSRKWVSFIKLKKILGQVNIFNQDRTMF